MATLASMPPININHAALLEFGNAWTANGERLSRTPPQSSGELGKLFDNAVAKSLATMLGGIKTVPANSNSLTPPLPDCVEVGQFESLGEYVHKTSTSVIDLMECALRLIVRH